MALKYLDILIGLAGVYVFLSIVCTAVKEMIAQAVEKRGVSLLVGIRQMLDGEFESSRKGLVRTLIQPPLELIGGVEGKIDLDALDVESLTKKLYEHPLIQTLFEGGKKPSHIPSDVFRTALLDVLPASDDASSEAAKVLDEIEASLKKLPEDLPARGALLAFVKEAEGDLKAFQKRVETWFDNRMERVATFYKNHVQRAVVVIALVVAVGANADSLRMVEQLASNETLRQAAVVQAEAIREDKALPGGSRGDSLLVTRTQKYVEAYGNLGLPIGWTDFEVPSPDADAGSGSLWALVRFWLLKVVGWLLTAVAISVGAPFWFDVLNRVSNIRTSGPMKNGN